MGGVLKWVGLVCISVLAPPVLFCVKIWTKQYHLVSVPDMAVGRLSSSGVLVFGPHACAPNGAAMGRPCTGSRARNGVPFHC